jgi:pyruvate/2-oxoglutarate dehydrogenase complex dihydrolipoamide dehydrogenase (E3) component
VSTAPRELDVIVLGAGPSGENVAGFVVKGGLTAIIVEHELVGGECSYWACMPSKALLRSGQLLDEARAVPGAKEAISGMLDSAATLARRDDFASHWQDSKQVDWLANNGVTLLRGHARLAGPRRVLVQTADGEVELRARQAVAICTGSRAAIPDLPGLREVEPWTSRESTSAKRAPHSLIVLGGGVVACEMALAWSRLGSERVTLVVRGKSLLGDLEPIAGKRVASAFEARGIRVLTDSGIERVWRGDDGVLHATLTSGEELVAEQLLVATGRVPATDDIGLESVGLAPASWLEVDDSLRVAAISGGWLYAAGDVNHRALLTHMGKYQARIAAAAIVARARGDSAADKPAAWSRYAASADLSAVPQVVFSDPEVAAVGLTESAARAKGLRVRAVDYEIGQVAGAALYMDQYKGHARMIIDEARGVLVGMTLVGPAVGELIHAATIAIVGEVPIARLWHAVPAYPTISEVWLRLLETLEG